MVQFYPWFNINFFFVLVSIKQRKNWNWTKVKIVTQPCTTSYHKGILFRLIFFAEIYFCPLIQTWFCCCTISDIAISDWFSLAYKVKGRCPVGGGGGGKVIDKVLYGEAAPQCSNPYPFVYHLIAKLLHYISFLNPWKEVYGVKLNKLDDTAVRCFC